MRIIGEEHTIDSIKLWEEIFYRNKSEKIESILFDMETWWYYNLSCNVHITWCNSGILIPKSGSVCIPWLQREIQFGSLGLWVVKLVFHVLEVFQFVFESPVRSIKRQGQIKSFNHRGKTLLEYEPPSPVKFSQITHTYSTLVNIHRYPRQKIKI